ncbi:YtxH domain-containing protein [uncultured Parabacteroides sp.]|uniref:YtxH domain-containing protein n=1 Tax=uncultured Parabacteroides sp. TaxID=512312 RepID=UPI0025E3924D|nr:YtxH domain-containing protein [uncultured Parabacteroides sp.]
METNNSKFWIGLGLGSIIGAVVYRFSYSSLSRQVKEKVYHSLHRLHGGAEVMMDEAKDKVLDAGTKAADKVADGTFKVAEKADEMKNKVHSYADYAKK